MTKLETIPADEGDALLRRNPSSETGFDGGDHPAPANAAVDGPADLCPSTEKVLAEIARSKTPRTSGHPDLYEHPGTPEECWLRHRPASRLATGADPDSGCYFVRRILDRHHAIEAAANPSVKPGPPALDRVVGGSLETPRRQGSPPAPRCRVAEVQAPQQPKKSGHPLRERAKLEPTPMAAARPRCLEKSLEVPPRAAAPPAPPPPRAVV